MAGRKKQPLTYSRFRNNGAQSTSKKKLVYPLVDRECIDSELQLMIELSYTAMMRWLLDGGLDHIFTGDGSYSEEPWVTLGISRNQWNARRAEAADRFRWLAHHVFISEFEPKLPGEFNPFTHSTKHPVVHGKKNTKDTNND